MSATSFKKNAFFQSIWKTMQENTYFSIVFLIYIILGGLTLLLLNQGDLLLYFSENRAPFWNVFFSYGTKLGEEWTYIFLLVFFLFIRFRYALLIPITGIIVTLISFLSKNFFLHPRPSTYYKALGMFEDINLVDGIFVVKGLSSFPSGHTMSGFAIFTLTALLISNKKEMAFFLFTLALIVGISRVYLVQHFLKDIYLGSIMGVFIAFIIFKVQHLLPISEQHWINKKLLF